MASMYPSLEDMTVHQYQMAQEHAATMNVAANAQPTMMMQQYPDLSEYMGLVVPRPTQQQVVRTTAPSGNNTQIAPVSGAYAGLARASVNHNVRHVLLVKDSKDKVGMRLRSFNKGVFVQFVAANSPAAQGGVRFGDQILQINGEDMAGMDADKAMAVIKKGDKNGVMFALRDRPFERTITLHKSSTGHLGFLHKNAQITSIVKDSSAARNGLLINHHLLELDGQCCIGLKDKEITALIQQAPAAVTLTVIPTEIYEHMMKCIGRDLLKRQDHSVPEV